MTRSLVIGAGGQIASDLIPALHARGDEVWMLDRVPAEGSRGYPSMAQAFADDPTWQRRWLVGNAASADEMGSHLHEIEPDVVFHLAALLSAKGEADPRLCWEVNMGSLRAVLDGMAATGKRRVLVWPSSIAAFGPLPDGQGFPDEPVPNEFPMLPDTMYGVTKVAGERLGQWYAAHANVDFRSLRFPGLLNATRPGGGSSDYANEMVFAAAEGREQVEVFVRPDTRIPFMHMADAVRTLTLLSEAPEDRLTRRVYNVTAFSPSAAEIAESLERAGRPLRVDYVPDHRQKYVDSWPDAIDDSLARRDWGWSHELDLDQTTRRLLDEIQALP